MFSIANTGNGGDGGYSNNNSPTGQAGGSGIVIVRYRTLMAHYAKIVYGKVTTVIVAEAEFFDTFVDDSQQELGFKHLIIHEEENIMHQTQTLRIVELL